MIPPIHFVLEEASRHVGREEIKKNSIIVGREEIKSYDRVF